MLNDAATHTCTKIESTFCPEQLKESTRVAAEEEKASTESMQTVEEEMHAKIQALKAREAAEQAKIDKIGVEQLVRPSCRIYDYTLLSVFCRIYFLFCRRRPATMISVLTRCFGNRISASLTPWPPSLDDFEVYSGSRG